jgi:hypothetical protein
MPFPWQPGHRITAGRLKAGILAGSVTLDFSDPSATITAGSSGYDETYFRATESVVFPSGFFSSVPFIVVTSRTTVPGVLLEVGYASPTVDGFDVVGARFTSTATVVDWIAIEM